MGESLKILHVTDIHCAYDRITQLKAWLKKERESVDVVLVSGDIADAPQEQGSEELIQEHHDHLLRVTLEFVSVAKKVYFVPGNVSNIEYPLNVHTRRVQLAPGLFLVGVGGSVPSFVEGKELWQGCPYSSDREFGEDLSSTLDPVLEREDSPSGDSYIVMTHDGPNNSNTTEIRSPSDPVIIAGSDILYEYLTKKKMQDLTVLNVHGHVHPSIGMSTIGKASVVNPGALIEGNFGMYTLRQVAGCQPAWKVDRVSLHRLG